MFDSPMEKFIITIVVPVVVLALVTLIVFEVMNI